ncbi:MAG: SigE family RNA polymerase sigma factor [Hamadaea sp.]|nr:SigE family RNA polymerase sigma factor [Hamadaea sp.]
MDFAEFYRVTSPRTLRYAYGLTGDLAQAQDVVQEAYIRAWQRWRRLSGYDDAEAWLRLVVSRLVFDWWRHLRVRRNAPVEQPAAVPPPSEDTMLVVAALKKLPERQRQALALHYLLDVSVAEIATELGVSEGTVKSWLSRGRDNLATVLKAELAQVPVGSADDVAELGQRRRRTKVAATVTAAGLVVIAVIVLATAVLGRNRTMPPPPTVNPTGSPMEFSTLRRVGSMPLDGLAFPEVAIVNGRAYAIDLSGTGVTVLSMSLADGTPAWPPVTLPPLAGGADGVTPRILATPDAILVLAGAATSSGWQTTAWMIDPATGEQRWHFNGSVEPDAVQLFPGVAVFPGARPGTIAGIDLRTGATRWQVSAAAQRVFGMGAPGDLARSDLGVGVPETGNSDGKMYVADGQSTITEYAAATGVPTGRVWHGIPPNDGFLAYHGDIYIRSARELYRLHVDDGSLVRVFTGGGVTAVAPCDLDDVCLIDATESGGRNVVALHDGRTKWTVSVPDAAFLDPVGLTLRVAPVGDGPVILLDSDGREVLRTARSSRVLRLDAGNFLVCEWTGDASVRLSGVPVSTLRAQSLGVLSVRAGQLAGDESALVAVVNGELVLYSIAR